MPQTATNTAGVDLAKLKKYGLKVSKDGAGGSSLALGTLKVVLSEVAATSSPAKSTKGGATSSSAARDRGSVVVKCCLRTADDVATAWPGM
jgi:hypothetical protein